MDAFKYTVMIEALYKEPEKINLNDFEEVLLTLSTEDLALIFSILSQHMESNHPVEQAKHIASMLQALWHYR